MECAGTTGPLDAPGHLHRGLGARAVAERFYSAATARAGRSAQGRSDRRAAALVLVRSHPGRPGPEKGRGQRRCLHRLSDQYSADRGGFDPGQRFVLGLAVRLVQSPGGGRDRPCRRVADRCAAGPPGRCREESCRRCRTVRPTRAARSAGPRLGHRPFDLVVARDRRPRLGGDQRLRSGFVSQRTGFPGHSALGAGRAGHLDPAVRVCHRVGADRRRIGGRRLADRRSAWYS